MKLSEFELEVLSLLWQEKESTAPELHKCILKKKKVTYSTVKTIIDRLEEKGAIKRVKNYGRTIVYAAAVEQKETQKPLVSSFINRVFAGKPRLLINHLLEEESLCEQDIKYLQSIINKRSK
jgi:BlaI family penicillinase repressor